MFSRNLPAIARPQLRSDYRASIPIEVLQHLVALGQSVPVEVLSDNAYLALLLIATACRVIVDAYQKAGGEWVVEVHGAYSWQECRYSPAGWEIMVRRYLAEAVTSSAMPLCDIWLDVCRQIAGERTNGTMLPDALAWAATPEEGGWRHA